jgi:hypothetical protein
MVQPSLLQHNLQPTDMLGLVMGHIDRFELLDTCRPSAVQLGVTGPGVKEDGGIAARGDDVGVGHADPKGHTQWMHVKRQTGELGLRVGTLR